MNERERERERENMHPHALSFFLILNKTNQLNNMPKIITVSVNMHMSLTPRGWREW